MDPILKAIEDLDKAIEDLDKKIDKNHGEFKRVMVGSSDQGGRGGIVRCLNDLESTVCGIPNSDDDRGLIGQVKDINEQINGENGLNKCVTRMKERQRIWNSGLTVGQAGALIIASIKGIFSG